MHLTLYINNKKVKSWPVVMPPDNPELTYEQNADARKDYVDLIVFNAKNESVGIRSGASWILVLEGRFKFPKEKIISKPVKLIEPVYMKIVRPAAEYSNSKSLYK